MSVNWGALSADNSDTGAQASALTAKMQKARDISRPGEQTMEGQLPARLIRHDEQTYRELKEAPQLAKAFGYDKIAPPVEKMTEWLRKKREDEEFVNFEKWVLATWDSNTPERKAWLKQMFPDIADRRAAFAYAKLDLQRNLVDIHIYGPQSREDFELLYAVMRGEFDLNEVLRPAWVAPTGDDDNSNATNYLSGLFTTNALGSGQEKNMSKKQAAEAFLRGISGFDENLWDKNTFDGEGPASLSVFTGFGGKEGEYFEAD